MAIVYKCKCCAGSLEVEEGMRLVKCPACRTKQTLPSSRDENIQNLFNRATTQRLKCEFDKAESVYERIIQADEEQYEAYWGLILCKFGVEYVEDPKTETRIPTCHRTSFESIVADENYKLALKYALDDEQKELYKQEAQEIDKIQKGILEVAQNEEPYDVFICYKETDENGKRTQDSVIANDIYHQLTQEGFKVFYAAITLEGKLGSAYEPIIFAALNSAKVMLAVGTKTEYFQAVWVKNEWSRFLKMNKDNRNKLLIPCYRGMDAYDLPDEFAHLQAQDMSKLGFITDLIRGVKKIIEKSAEKPVAVVVNQAVNLQAENLATRAELALEDGDFEKARGFAEQALNLDVKYAKAYVVEMLCDFKVKKLQNLSVSYTLSQVEANANYKKAVRFAVGNLKEELENLSKAYLFKQIMDGYYIKQEDYEAARKKIAECKGFKLETELFAELEALRNQQLLNLVRNLLSSNRFEVNEYINNITNEDIKTQLLAELGNARNRQAVQHISNMLEKNQFDIEEEIEKIPNKNLKIKLYDMRNERLAQVIRKLLKENQFDIKEYLGKITDEKLKMKLRDECNKHLEQIVRNMLDKNQFEIEKYINATPDEAFKSYLMNLKLEKIYNIAIDLKDKKQYYAAKAKFLLIKEYKNAQIQADDCDKLAKEEERQQEETAKKAKKKKWVVALVSIAISIIIFIGAFIGIGEAIEYNKKKDFKARYGCVMSLSSDGKGYVVSSLEDRTWQKIVIPDTYKGKPVVAIGYRAFADCNGLTSITIPEGVTSIGDYAFYECDNLTEIVIPDSVTSIGYEAFFHCSGLTSVVIGSGVTIIGSMAFRGCPKLVEVVNKSSHITVEQGSSAYGYVGYWTLAVYNSNSGVAESQLTNDNGYMICTDGAEKILVGYNGMETDLILPSYITKINQYAFYGCDNLTSVEIPDSVTSIGESAFYSCDSLTSVGIGDSVTSIGDRAFIGCTELTSVVIGDSVTSIGFSAFAWCDSLTSVEIGDSVTSIGDSAFDDCKSLTSVVIPDSVTSIGKEAFKDCSGLTSVEIGDSVTSIGDRAFRDCSGLTSLVIGDGVTSIGSLAFEYCDSLTEMIVPDSVTSIGSSAFAYCNSLTSVYYKGTADEWLNISIDDNNSVLTSATLYYYSENEPALNADGTAYDGNYWKYDENGEIYIWTKETV